MSISLAGHKFEGPILNSGNIKPSPGVFAVLTVIRGTAILMDIDSGANIRRLVKNHPRKGSWYQLSKSVGYVFVVQYQSVKDRKKRQALVDDIREKMDVKFPKLR